MLCTNNRMIEEMAAKDDFLFLNYEDEKPFRTPEYFQYAIHLNDIGAKEYRKEGARVLKKIYLL